MTTHITLTTFVVFFALAAFGAVVFALAHFASHGAFSPIAEDDLAAEADMLNDEDEERAAPVHRSEHVPHDSPSIGS